MAHHGHTGEGEKESGENGNSNGNAEQTDADRSGPSDSRASSDTRVGSPAEHGNDASEVTVDPEKGRDVTIVSWFSENDPEVSLIDISLHFLFSSDL